jgi:hypothetical protein
MCPDTRPTPGRGINQQKHGQQRQNHSRDQAAVRQERETRGGQGEVGSAKVGLGRWAGKVLTRVRRGRNDRGAIMGKNERSNLRCGGSRGWYLAHSFLHGRVEEKETFHELCHNFPPQQEGVGAARLAPLGPRHVAQKLLGLLEGQIL